MSCSNWKDCKKIYDKEVDADTINFEKVVNKNKDSRNIKAKNNDVIFDFVEKHPVMTVCIISGMLGFGLTLWGTSIVADGVFIGNMKTLYTLSKMAVTK